MEIFRLFGSVFIENEKANKSLQQTDQKAEKVGKTLQSTIKTASKWGQEMGKQLTTVGTNISKKVGVPLAALTALMGGLAKTTADYTATVKDNAAIVGLNAKSYQELQYAMQQSGLSQDDFVRMMGRVNQRIGFARQGNEKYRKSIEKLGISLADVDAGLVDTEDTFLAMIQYLHEMDDAQQQAAVAGDFFGVMLARRMMPLIRDGAESVEELRQRAHELGLVMDDLAIAKGDLLSDTLDDLSFTAKGLGRIFGSEMHAPMINISKAITDVIARFSTWLTENPKVVRQIIVWGGAIAGVLGVLVTLGTTLIVTGKIIGALGVIFNILTSKPVLIIAAIGALYLAWTNDWLGIRTAVEKAWEVIGPIVDAIIKWGKEKLETTWNWTIENVPKFLKWISETAWPWFNDKVSTAWNWSKGKVSDFIIWIQETAWPFINKAATTTWNWSRGKVGDFITWIKEVAWPFIDGVVTTTWNWVEGEAVPAVVQAGKAIINAVVEVSGKVWESIKKGYETGDWADFWGVSSDLWSKGVVIAISLSSAVQGIGAVLTAISKGLGLVATGATVAGSSLGALGTGGILGAITVAIQLVEAKTAGLGYKQFAQNLIWSLIAGFAVAGITANPKLGALVFTVTMNLKWDWLNDEQKEISKQLTQYDQFTQEYLKNTSWFKRPFTVVPRMDSQEYQDWLKLQDNSAFKDTVKNVSELNVELTQLEKQALIISEVFRQGGDLEQALAVLGIAYWETRGLGGYAHTDPKTGKVIRGDAGEYGIGQIMPETGLDVWTRIWKQPAETFDVSMLEDIDTNISMMVSYFIDRYKAEGEDVRLAIEAYNRGSAIDGMQAYTLGVIDWMEGPDGQSMFDVMYKGSAKIFDAWIQAGYDKETDVRKMAAYVAKALSDNLMGQSPPPEGPLASIDKGASNVMDAWVEGAKDGLKDGVPKLTGALENIKNLFASIWDKVPEEIKGPIEQAFTWMTDLIGQAEEALFQLDEFQEELDALLGGGASPEEQAQGFMARLAAGLNERLDQLDEPMNRFTDAIFSAGRSTLEFGKALLSGNWIEALLTIIMETEAFAKAMELLGAILRPVIELFDAVLLPIIEAIISVWNFVLEKLASISIFGWRPFARLTEAMIETSRDKKPSGDSSGSSGGRQISEITGPTRDLLVDLLSPLANFGQIVAPIQDIRDILDQRLPNFNAFGMEFAAAGAGAMSPAVVIENLNVTAPTTGVDDISRATIDQIERALAGRIAFGQRGRGGR